MSTKFIGKFDVILTDEAITLLSTQPFAIDYLFCQNGYIEATEVNPEGYYLHMIVEGTTEAGEFRRELLLPHQYVRFVISSHPGQPLGFGKSR